VDLGSVNIIVCRPITGQRPRYNGRTFAVRQRIRNKQVPSNALADKQVPTETIGVQQ
jgi:hypothetical protein